MDRWSNFLDSRKQWQTSQGEPQKRPRPVPSLVPVGNEAPVTSGDRGLVSGFPLGRPQGLGWPTGWSLILLPLDERFLYVDHGVHDEFHQSAVDQATPFESTIVVQ